MLSNLSVVRGQDSNHGYLDIGPELLIALLYYLDNSWNPAEGNDKKKPVQSQNSRKAKELEVPDASQAEEKENTRFLLEPYAIRQLPPTYQ